MFLRMRRRKLIGLLFRTLVVAGALGAALGCVTLGHVGHIVPAAVDAGADRKTLIAKQCLAPRDFASARQELRGRTPPDPNRTPFNGLDGTLLGLLNGQLLRGGMGRIQNVAIGFSTKLIFFPCVELYAIRPALGREDGLP